MAIMVTVAILVERRQRRRDQADGVLMTWDDLRLTRTYLIVGSAHDAQTLPLGGLKAIVDITTSPGQADGDQTVHLTIQNGSLGVHRSQPYSYGASGNAQTFAIMFNTLSGHLQAAHDLPDSAAYVAFVRQSDRRAA
jgi:hypothetical protein